MDRLFRLVIQFSYMRHNVGHVNYITCFIETMTEMSLLIEETMMDARDVHDRERYYMQIFSLNAHLRELLRAYSNAINVAGSDGASGSEGNDEGISLFGRNNRNNRRINHGNNRGIN